MNHDEYEWLKQELATERERLGTNPAEEDATIATYRLIARALAEPPAISLPADFAQHVTNALSQQTGIDQRFEQRLLAVLFGCLVLSGTVVAWLYGAEWLAAIARHFPSTDRATIHWLGAALACVGMSWAAGLLGSGTPRPTAR
jgi:hypothetical protein